MIDVIIIIILIILGAVFVAKEIIFAKEYNNEE